MPVSEETEAIEGAVTSQCVDAAMAVFDRVLSVHAPRRDVVVEALQAADEAAAAVAQAEADRMVAGTGLISMESLPEQGVRLRIALGLGLAHRMLGAFRAVLDANPGAINYVEQEFVSQETGESYVAILVRPGGRTPHQLRLEAERERDWLRARLDGAHDALECGG